MPRGFYKHKIVFDENMPQRHRLPLLNKQFDLKHVKDDFAGGGLGDPDVYDLGVRLSRVIVTYNGKHYRSLAGTKKDAGIIDVPSRLPIAQLDTRLTAFLKKTSPKSLAGKYIPLWG